MVYNEVTSLKTKVQTLQDAVNDMKKTLEEIHDTQKQDREVTAQKLANDLRSSTGTPWGVVTRRFPKADRPLMTIASTSQLLALSVDDIVEHLEQHTGVSYAGIPLQDLRMRLAHELGVNLAIFQVEVGKLALKRKFVEDEAAGMDQ